MKRNSGHRIPSDLRAAIGAFLNAYRKEARPFAASEAIEGGAIGKPQRTEAQRRIDNDTDGTRRRAKATKDRNELI